MTRQPYGDWTASLAAASGARVQFRALGTNGGVVASDVYAWPPA